MAGKKKINLESGVLTKSMNSNSKEFSAFKSILSKKANSLSEKQKLEIELLSMQIQMEDYLQAEESEIAVITVGDFLRRYLEQLNIKQNKLADYLGLKPSNFSKLLSGARKVNFELSFALSQIFNLDPKIWILIQVKNDYIDISKSKKKSQKKYKLDDLVNL